MTISPGWYPDPAEPGTQRYWDGGGWVGAPLPTGVTPPDGPPPEQTPPSTRPAPDGVAESGPAAATGDRVSGARDGATPPVLGGRPPLPGLRGMATGWPQPGPAAPVRPHGMPLATPAARLVARIIDIGIVLLLNVVVNGWFVYMWLREVVPYVQTVMRLQQETGELFPKVDPPKQYGTLMLVIVLLAMALWFAYEVPATAHSGQTFGKRAARIKVVRHENLEPLGFSRAWRRWNPMAMPLLLWSCCGPLAIPFIVALQFVDVIFISVDRVQRMALHDRSAVTYVVQLPGHTENNHSRSDTNSRPDKRRSP